MPPAVGERALKRLRRKLIETVGHYNLLTLKEKSLITIIVQR